jgi:dipicolinate synthase subunit A
VPAWSNAQVAILGGDAREIEVIRGYLEACCRVRTYGVIGGTPYDQLAVGSARNAVDGAQILVTPMPGPGPDDTLYAPHAPAPIAVTRELLAAAQPGAFYFGCWATATMHAAGEPLGIRFRHLVDDDELMVLHAISTAEGAIALTIQRTAHTIHNADALVIGYGRIGSLLARDLRGLGARVTIAARRRAVAVRAFADGYAVCQCTPEVLAAVIGRVDLTYTTAQEWLLTHAVLSQARPGALVMDLASPPGGMDHDAAHALGLNVVWARAQAGSAPRHAGHAQFRVMARILDAEWDAGPVG